jgi:hypothetical protein
MINMVQAVKWKSFQIQLSCIVRDTVALGYYAIEETEWSVSWYTSVAVSDVCGKSEGKNISR